MKTNQRKNLISDLIAGLTTAIADMPDAMASAVLAGTNPVYGLYAIMVGKPVGALLTSSQFITLGVTSAMALTAGSALSGLSGEEHAQALFTLTLLIGLFQVIAGLLKMGRLMRYVSNAVMIGFLTGVSLLVVLSQLGDFTGFSSEYSNKVAQSFDLLLHPRGIAPQTLAVGLLTVVMVLVLNRTRLSNFSMLIALVLASGAVALLQPGPRRVLRASVPVLFVLVTARTVYSHHTNPDFGKEQWKEVVAQIDTESDPDGTLVLVAPDMSVRSLLYYLDDSAAIRVQGWRGDEVTVADDVLIWVVVTRLLDPDEVTATLPAGWKEVSRQLYPKETGIWLIAFRQAGS